MNEYQFKEMPSYWYDDYPTLNKIEMRKAWYAHYLAKGCSKDKAYWLAKKKTHTWP